MNRYKYEKEINQCLEILIREDWMDDSDYALCLALMLQESPETFEIMHTNFENGINIGFSAEQQIDAVRALKLKIRTT